MRKITTTRTALSTILVIVATTSSNRHVLGLGFSLEPTKGPFGIRSSSSSGRRTSNSRLHAKEYEMEYDNEDSSTEIAAFRERLDETFGIFDGDDVNNPLGAFFGKNQDDDDDETTTSVVRQSLDRIYNIDVAAYAGLDDDGDDDDNTVSFDFDVDNCVGDQCSLDDEECEIPEEFKLLPNTNTVNVMDFLGIQRAEPLKAHQTTTDDWQ